MMNIYVVISVTATVWVILLFFAFQTRREVKMWKNANKAIVKVTGYWEKFGQKVGVEVILNAREPDEQCQLFVKDKERLEKIEIGDEIEVLWARVLTGSGRVGVEKSNATHLRFTDCSPENDAKKVYIALAVIAIIVPVFLLCLYLL